MRKGDNYLRRCVKEFLDEHSFHLACKNEDYQAGFIAGVKEFVDFWFEVDVDNESEDD